VKHQSRQAVRADVRSGWITGHRDLKSLDCAGWLPRHPGSPGLPRRFLLHGIADLPACAKGEFTSYPHLHVSLYTDPSCTTAIPPAHPSNRIK
jgi:hypothetical protein